ncbi:stalk domain-containing protein [Anaerobacillus isosaccharinicus]|uniref:Stalk domain-containing protein n=1 Tax=Anaerobacillus isosaccharinicus TaxID=1532552 RepID=A0A7S7LAZ2_9BACI|nr:stalk domain-containing protein [Anaerobacillus isosaccharinicus]MBA5588880.1 hypothetical protein [Anaerobacillus isosaccharinicus]QOY37733.1 hypothetical protein AWH56_009180 [Anaerobacillus isosaccharinicus]
MKKILLSSMIIFFCLVTFNPMAGASSPIYTQLNPYIVEEGKSYIQYFFLDSFNLEMEPYGDRNFFKISDGEKEFYLDDYIILEDGLLLLPVRSILEYFDYTVSWNSQTKHVEFVSYNFK